MTDLVIENNNQNDFTSNSNINRDLENNNIDRNIENDIEPIFSFTLNQSPELIRSSLKPEILSFYKEKKKYINRLKYLNGKASTYYNYKHLRLYLPSIIISGLSSIMSFLASSKEFDDDITFLFTVMVGVFTTIVSILQSIASVTNDSMKSKLHREAYENYDKLLTKLSFEIILPNEKNFINNLEKEILKIKSKCKYPIPQFLIKNYDSKIKCINDNVEYDTKFNHSDV